MSLNKMMSFSTRAAMRSTISCDASNPAAFTMSSETRKTRIARPRTRGRPQIEKDLETGESCASLPQRANLASCGIARTGNRNHKRRTIELIAEIDANGTHRRLISHPQTQSVRKIIELIRAIRGAHGHVRWPGR